MDTNPLTNLATITTQMADLPPQRDALIVAARRAGYQWRTIADAARLTPTATQAAAKRANGGVLPLPQERQPGARSRGISD